MGNDKLLTVGELAGKFGVTVRALQYYDREGVLSPSMVSEGGRRLYAKRDMVALHQILALKRLGFSLEEIKRMRMSLTTPREVAATLEKQGELVRKRLEQLEATLVLIDALREEALRINAVDFDKYADIIALLMEGNGDYWVWAALDDTLTDHIKDRFSERPEAGVNLFDVYRALLEEAFVLKNGNEPPDSERSDALAEKWWAMVTEFTGGDLNLLPNLLAFNNSKSGWNEEMAVKQKAVDEYIGQLLARYFARNAISIPDAGGVTA